MPESVALITFSASRKVASGPISIFLQPPRLCALRRAGTDQHPSPVPNPSTTRWL